jgi:PAS domain S-box-containing protein
MRTQADRAHERDIDLLVEAGVALAESLDLETTLGRVAQLTIPRLADLCVIDLLADDGSIRQMAVASVDEKVAADLRTLRERQELDPDGEHPVAHVIRSGEPALLAQMGSSELRTFASGSRHARFMIENGYHSAVVAPLVARRRTLGALSVLRLSNEVPYEEGDLAVVYELARRAALAIDNARLYSEVRRVEQRLAAILVNLAEAITLTDADDQIVFANEAAAELFGARTPEALMRSNQEQMLAGLLLLDEHGRELSPAEMPRMRLFAREEAEPLLIHSIVRASGDERWLIAKPAPVVDPETGRLLFSVNVYEDITEVKRTQIAESFMAEASRVLASSMDYAETLSQIAKLTVPQIADWCAIDVLDEDGEIVRLATYNENPELLELAERLRGSYGPSLGDDSAVAEVIATGRARIYPDIGADALAAHARDSEHLAMLQAIGARAAIVVPLAAPSRTVGAITLASSASLRRLSHRDLALVERLGRRAGTAVESARLYTERKRIADTLQAALLPEALPEIEGVQTSALYRAAGELNRVGGDFYDVCACGGDRWMLAIGDVCGKGPRAAGVTALARHTLRAAARLYQSPTGILSTLHDALTLQPLGADMCTVCLVMIEPHGDRARLCVALAGHPPPVLIRADGQAEQIGTPGTLLGVIDALQIHEVEVALGADETLLLYTDGVLEAGAPDRQIGEEGLLALCGEAPGLALDELLRRIEQAAVERTGDELRDDIAMLGLRLTPSAGGARRDLVGSRTDAGTVTQTQFIG